jgi:hypothetical protein
MWDASSGPLLASFHLEVDWFQMAAHWAAKGDDRFVACVGEDMQYLYARAAAAAMWQRTR